MANEHITDDSQTVPTEEPPGGINPTEETPIGGAPGEVEATEFSDGSWVRQVFIDAQGLKKIATTFVPDNPEEAADREIEDYDDENTNDWEQLLGDPPVNIDEGIAILRLDNEAELATTTWLPNEEGLDILRKTLKQIPEQPDGPTVNLRDFRDCFRNQAALERVQRFRRCMHHLHS